MEGNRLHSGQKLKPTTTLNLSKFKTLKNLDFGDKGELDMSGVIVRDRKIESGDIIKTVQLTQAILNRDLRI